MFGGVAASAVGSGNPNFSQLCSLLLDFGVLGSCPASLF